MRTFLGIACALAATASHAAVGQRVTVRGVVYDSLHSRPLAGALVAIGPRTTTSDSAGRFALEVIAPGTYRVTAQHDAVDRLGMSAIGRQANVTDGSEVVRVAIPSFAGLWRLACGPTPPAIDTGFVFGTVRASKSARGIMVSASWIDVVASGTKVSQKRRTLEVTADSLGNFALCGVPTSTGFSVRATDADSSASGTFDIAPLDRERVIRRDLALIHRLARTTATITGKVLADSGGGPIANAEIALVNASMTAKSNERGEYSFGELGPGSYRVYVRKIGYAAVEVVADVEAGDRRRQDIVMNRITLLASVAVTGKVFARDEQMRVFEERRKIALGKFLTAEELDKAGALKLNTLIREWPGVYIPNKPKPEDRDPVSKRGIRSLSGGACKMAIYLDGIRLAIPLEHVPPQTLAGVEYYPSATTIPIEYAQPGNQCGVILLHSRYRTGK